MDTNDFYREFGNRLRAAREATGLTQAELADRVAMSRPSIANVERGRQRIAVHQLVAIALALGVEPSRLFPALGGLAARVGRAMHEAGLSDETTAEITAWSARAVERLQSEENGDEQA
jgi:transcriptional regulator with XRE-family HTH domain